MSCKVASQLQLQCIQLRLGTYSDAPQQLWPDYYCSLLALLFLDVQQHKTRWCEYCWKEVTCEQLQLRFIRYHAFWEEISLSRFFFLLLLFIKTLSPSCKCHTGTFSDQWHIQVSAGSGGESITSNTDPGCSSSHNYNTTAPKSQNPILLILGDRSFATAGPTLWNRLPEQLRQPDITFGQLKRSLKTFMFG